MRTLILVLILTSCGGWSHADTIREFGFYVTGTVDETQTIDITHDCNETNPIIGECGTRVSVGSYWFVTFVTHAAISAALPPAARSWWQALTLGGEIATIWNNWRSGY